MITLAQIAELLTLPAPPGAAERQITGLATLADAGETELSYVSSDAFAKDVASSRAAAVLVGKRVRLPVPSAGASDAGPAVLVVDDAELATAAVLELFAPPVPRPAVGVDPAARVAPSASVGEGAAIGPNVFIGERVVLGSRVVLHAGVYLGDEVRVGDDCELFPNVVVRERITLGSRVTIHAGSVLGSDGFGYRWDGQRHRKVPHIGTVIVEDDVEIGSCTCIDRAKLSATVIGRGTKIDNLVQIGHNVRVGPHCVLVGQAAVAGSVNLGAGVVLGGQAAVRDHINLGDGAVAAACSGVAEDVPARTVVSGTPALPHRQSLREQAALRKLPDLIVQMRRLQERLAELEKQSQSA